MLQITLMFRQYRTITLNIVKESYITSNLLSSISTKYFLLITILLFIQNPSFSTEYNIFSDEEDIAQETEISDPFEKINRKIYSFNITIDKYTLKPIAKTYRKIIPNDGRIAIGNAINNLTLPLTAINSLLQLDFKNTVNSILKFGINSTIGMFGMFDIAKKIGITVKNEDLAQTMGKYKVPPGPYLMLPFLGPATLRDISGTSIEWIFDPTWDEIIDIDHKNEIRYSLAAINSIDMREKLLDILDDIEKNSLDPYSVIKSAYIQRRETLIDNK